MRSLTSIPHLQEPEKYIGDEGYKQAFLDAIAEYNSYGISASNPKYRVDDQQALDLFGFKATLLIITLNCWLKLMNWLEDFHVPVENHACRNSKSL